MNRKRENGGGDGRCKAKMKLKQKKTNRDKTPQDIHKTQTRKDDAGQENTRQFNETRKKDKRSPTRHKTKQRHQQTMAKKESHYTTTTKSNSFSSLLCGSFAFCFFRFCPNKYKMRYIFLSLLYTIIIVDKNIYIKTPLFGQNQNCHTQKREYSLVVVVAFFSLVFWCCCFVTMQIHLVFL
jgi:hypothetical protein